MSSPNPRPSAPRSGTLQRYLDRLSRLLVIMVCIEVGLCLVVLPWTGLWNMNFFAGFPQLRYIWPNPYFRGAVSGVGLLNIWIGLQEARALWRSFF